MWDQGKVVNERWFLSCGAGYHQIPLAQAVKAAGLRLAVCDGNPHAPLLSMGLVDRFLPVSLLDAPGIEEAVQRDPALHAGLAGIYARSYGRAVEVAHAIARRRSLTSNPHRALRFFRDKRRYKARLSGWQVPVPADRSAELGPWIVRPESGHAKEGIRILEDPADRANLPASAFVEPLVQGRECILLGLVVKGTYYPIVLTDRFKNADFTDSMHVFPSSLPGLVRYQMVEHCRRIVRRSGLENGPFLAEFVVDEGDHPFLIECAPEVGGEFLADDLIPLMTGLPYFEILVRLYAGMDADGIRRELREHIERERTRSMVIRYLPPREPPAPAQPGPLFPADLFRDPGFCFARELPSGGLRQNTRRPGVFALTGGVEERQALIERANVLAGRLPGLCPQAGLSESHLIQP